MKKWYRSKTLWTNLIAVAAFITQQFTGYVIDPEIQASALIILNIILRFYTEEKIA